jgi:hypothetical protein
MDVGADVDHRAGMSGDTRIRATLYTLWIGH